MKKLVYILGIVIPTAFVSLIGCNDEDTEQMKDLDDVFVGFWIKLNGNGRIIIDSEGYAWGVQIVKNGEVTMARWDYSGTALNTEASGPMFTISEMSAGSFKGANSEEQINGTYAIDSVINSSHYYYRINLNSAILDGLYLPGGTGGDWSVNGYYAKIFHLDGSDATLGNAPVEERVAAHYPFDGNANDHVGNQNASLYGNPSFAADRNGNSSSALLLDGTDDYVELGDFNLGSSFSVSFWINPMTTENGQAFIALNTYAICNFCENGMILGYWSDGVHIDILGNYYEAGTPITGWHHLALTIEEQSGSSQVTVYRNGSVLWAHAISAVVPQTNLRPWFLGQEIDGASTTSNFFNGMVDDVRFYTDVLAESEVATLYSDM